MRIKILFLTLLTVIGFSVVVSQSAEAVTYTNSPDNTYNWCWSHIKRGDQAYDDYVWEFCFDTKAQMVSSEQANGEHTIAVLKTCGSYLCDGYGTDWWLDLTAAYSTGCNHNGGDFYSTPKLPVGFLNRVDAVYFGWNSSDAGRVVANCDSLKLYTNVDYGGYVCALNASDYGTAQHSPLYQICGSRFLDNVASLRLSP